MREFLEDAEQHREDGYGRAQAHVKRQLPKRFYKDATVIATDDGYAVGLDGKVPRTPGMKRVVVPSASIAEAMAAEWSAQDKEIDPMTMPMTRLVNSAVEAGDTRGTGSGRGVPAIVNFLTVAGQGRAKNGPPARTQEGASA